MGVLACTACHQEVPDGEVEMTANGWRCKKCSLQAQIDVHHGADEGIGQIGLHDMEERANRAALGAWGGIAAAVILTILIALGVFSPDSESRAERRGFTKAVLLVPLALTFAGYELYAWKRARTAVAIMRERGEPPFSL